jgi:hypothetical protein
VTILPEALTVIMWQPQTRRRRLRRARHTWAHAQPYVRQTARNLILGTAFLWLVVVAVAYGVALWKMPDWMGAHDPSDRNNARLLVVSVGGAVVVVIGLLYTAFNYQLNRRGQVTDRFVKALERLGSERLYVRYGGLLALEQIVQDAPDQAVHAAQVINTFVREHAPRSLSKPNTIETSLPGKPAEDVVAALTALTRRASRRRTRGEHIPDLSGLHMAGASFVGADLSDSWLTEADLTKASFHYANLAGAVLRGTCLREARLEFAILYKARLYETDLSNAILAHADLADARLILADLTNANLGYACLRNAQLTGAILTGADLQGADLSNAAVDEKQILSAWPTRSTRLPAGMADSAQMRARVAEDESRAAAKTINEQ